MWCSLVWTPLALGGGGIIAGIVIGVPLALILGVWIRWRDRVNTPTGQRRADLIRELRRMAADGNGFQERRAFLESVGLRSNVAEGLVVDAERQEPARIDEPVAVSRGGVSFMRPANWHVQDLLDGAGSPRHFSVEGLNSAAVIFMVGHDDALAVPSLDALVDAQCRKSSQEVEESFMRWAGLTGEGRILRGAVLKQPIETRIFCCQDPKSPRFAVLWTVLDEDRDDAQAGFDLIERTFRIDRQRPGWFIDDVQILP